MNIIINQNKPNYIGENRENRENRENLQQEIAYIIHYTPNVERKKHILNELYHANLHGIFIEKYDRDVLLPNEYIKFDYNILSMGSISLLLKHIEAWKLISESTNKNYGIIFEDDVILCDNFIYNLDLYIKQLPCNFDVLMINAGCNLHIPSDKLINGIHVYERGTHSTNWGGNGGTRCLDGYIISKETAKKYYEYFINLPDQPVINKQSDWFTNIIMKYYQSNVYWAEPNLVIQGSETGLFNLSYSK